MSVWETFLFLIIHRPEIATAVATCVSAIFVATAAIGTWVAAIAASKTARVSEAQHRKFLATQQPFFEYKPFALDVESVDIIIYHKSGPPVTIDTVKLWTVQLSSFQEQGTGQVRLQEPVSIIGEPTHVKLIQGEHKKFRFNTKLPIKDGKVFLGGGREIPIDDSVIALLREKQKRKEEFQKKEDMDERETQSMDKENKRNGY